MKQLAPAPDKEQGRRLDLATSNVALRRDDKIQGAWFLVAHTCLTFSFSYCSNRCG